MCLFMLIISLILFSVQVAHAVLKDYMFVHLPNFHDKFSLLM